MKCWIELKADRRAVTALEYALIAGVIVATVVVGFQTLANNLSARLAGITF
jgi:Flp pilus assembly pilin Flp